MAAYDANFSAEKIYRQNSSLFRVVEFVVVYEVVAAPHGEPHTVVVVLDVVARNFGVENLQQRYSGVAVVMDVVI